MFLWRNVNNKSRQQGIGQHFQQLGLCVLCGQPPVTAKVTDETLQPLRMSQNITWPGGVTVKPKGLRIKRNITVSSETLVAC